MSQEDQSMKISPQDKENTQPKTTELSDKDLDKVAGGTTIGSATGGAGAGKLVTEEIIIGGRHGAEFLNPQPLPP